MAKPNFILPNKPAIKAGSILSYNYTDDLKFAAEPLDFSRNSSATRVNEQGLIEEVGYFGPQLVQNGDFSQEGSELVTNGDFATDSGWSKGTGWSISGGSASRTAQSGSTACDQSISLNANKTYKIVYDLTVDAGSFNVRFSGTTNVNGETRTTSGTYTDYLKAATGNNTFRLVGADSAFTGSIDNVSVKEVGQDWTISSEVTIQNNSATFTLAPSGQQASQAISSVIGKKYKIIYEIKSITQGAFDVSIGGNLSASYNNSVGIYTEYLTATTTSGFYVRSRGTTSGSITNVSVIEIIGDKPRIDYSDSSTEPSLLLEPQSTNLIPYSEDFSGYYKGSNTTLTYESNVVAPDGSLGVYRLQMPNLGSSWLSFGFLGNTSRNASIYVKSVNDGVNNQFNINATGISPNTLTATNNWQRFSRDFGSNQNYDVGINNGLDAYTTDVYIFGAQVEALSYATSYIPTSGSTATRLGETATNAGGAGVFNSEEGVLYAEIAALVGPTTGNRHLAISDGTNSNRLYFYYRVGGGFGLASFVGGVLQANVTFGGTITNNSKVACVWKENDYSLWVDGVEVGTDTSASVWSSGTLNTLNFAEPNGTSSPFYSKTKNIKVFNYALTDEELQTLTT